MSDLFGDIFSGIEEESSYSLIPEGNYNAVVEEAKIKQTKSKTGFYINVKYKLCDNAKFNGKYIFDVMNIKNDSEKAQELGRGRLKRMLSIQGVDQKDMEGKGPEFLVGKKFNLYIKHDKQEGYETREKITSISEFKATNDDSVEKEQKAAGNIPDSWV